MDVEALTPQMDKRLKPSKSIAERQLLTLFSWSGERRFSGYVVDTADLTKKFVVELIVDGWAVKTARAGDYVQSLASEKIGDGCYGFSFSLPEIELNDSLVVEARIANVGTVIGAPIVIDAQPETTADPSGPGQVRWIGGLRFSGWMAEEGEESIADVLVGGELISRIRATGWSHLGQGNDARAARSFDLHLPERFADGRVRHVAIITRRGENLAGSPHPFVAFADGLANTISSFAILESERLRGKLFDQLIPISMPMSRYPEWSERFPTPSAEPVAMQGAVMMVGPGSMDDTLESLNEQTHEDWVAALLPTSNEPAGFHPDHARAFLDSDATASEFIVFGVAGTLLAPNALARIAAVFAASGDAQAVYGDLDITGDDGSRWPLAFSAFDYERMLEQGYCAHLFALRRATAERAFAAGATNLYRLFNSGFDDESIATADVVHLPGALGALPQFNANAAKPTLVAATRAHLQERGVSARVTAGSGHVLPAARVARNLGRLRTTVVIPTRNRRNLLEDCIESIRPALERQGADIIVVDNDSSEPETLDYLAAIDGDIATVLRVAGDFNFAKLNNVAAAAASGDVLCLLNNDIKALDENWLDEMLSRIAEPDVGAVGALLLWPSGVVQHGGVVLGPSFAATHAFNDRIASDGGYADLLTVAHECSAVTAACFVTRRADYLDVGGMDEIRFPVNFNDVDYCLKLRATGKRIVFTPHARLLHLESASRGTDRNADRKHRFERELENLRAKWGEVVAADPYYNPLLSLDGIPFSALAWPARSMAPRTNERPVARPIPPGF